MLYEFVYNALAVLFQHRNLNRTLKSFVLKEVGEREGKYYAINVPLKDGIDDTSFTRLFKTVSFSV